MALKLWLPLNGDLTNNGLSLLPAPSSNTLVYEAGKIGQCGKGTVAWHLSEEIIGNSWTVATWYKSQNTWSSANNIIFCKNTSLSTDCHIYFSIINGTSLNIGVNGPSSDLNTSYTFTKNVFYHLAATYDGNKVSLYVNGNLLSSKTVTTAVRTGALNIRIDGRATNAANTTTTGNLGCNYNDFRLYDECLSPLEIKELSQGLVIHYKLNEVNNKNLILNGFGELGKTCWSATGDSYYTNENLPNNFTKLAFTNNLQSAKYIEIFPKHSYTLKMYIKAINTSGTNYPSILPYDIDKKFIAHLNTRDGFVLSSATTLSQPLNTGDTVIHATDLTNWPTASGTYRNLCAIFGYKDSQGYVYPDFEYTQNCPRFFNGTGEKTTVDKTNNTITLSTAYTGPYVPAGTTICCSADGSTYYYPFGGINYTTITNWTQKTVTFTPDTINRIKYSKYWIWMCYTGAWETGLELYDNSTSNGQLVDSSGYSNNALVTGSLVLSPDSPKYTYCTGFNQLGTSYGDTGSGTFAWFPFDKCTIANWMMPTEANSSWGGSCGIQHDSIESYYGKCLSNQFYANKFQTAYATGNGWAYVDSGITCEPNVWHHVVTVLDGTTVTQYVDGEFIKSATINWNTAITNAETRFALGVDFPGSNEVFKGFYSDIRFYVTALNAEDIKALYNVSAKINSTAQVHSFEFLEKLNNRLAKANHTIATKTWTYCDLLKNYTQTNCQVTLTDEGLRIYRPPNLTQADDGNTMYGGMRIANTYGGTKHEYRNEDNQLGLEKGHTYLLLFHVQGKTSAAISLRGWTNQMGWGGGGLSPSPSSVSYGSVPANFTGETDYWYKWTINDDVVKTCTTAYSYAQLGKQYLSYADFTFGFAYTSTGEMGTEIYITNLRLYDITTIDKENIFKNGTMQFSSLIESDRQLVSIQYGNDLLSNEIIEA